MFGKTTSPAINLIYNLVVHCIAYISTKIILKNKNVYEKSHSAFSINGIRILTKEFIMFKNGTCNRTLLLNWMPVVFLYVFIIFTFSFIVLMNKVKIYILIIDTHDIKIVYLNLTCLVSFFTAFVLKIIKFLWKSDTTT